MFNGYLNEYLNEYNIYGCLSTYDSIIDKPNVLIKFIEDFNEKIVKPLGRELQFYARGNNLRIRPEYLPFNEKNFERLKKAFNEKKIYDIKFADYYVSFEDTSDQCICLSIELTMYKAPIIEISVNNRYYDGVIAQEVSETFVSLIEELTKEFDNAAGYITFDRTEAGFRCPSAHECYIRKGEYSITQNTLERYFRGYFWGDFLSKNHVELLGGYERVEKEAPVVKVIPLSGGGAYLQLTEDINNVSDEDLKKLKNYFKEIILQRKKGMNYRNANYGGQRVIEDEIEG